ncbi:tRNA1(Val) (adenine(37)-N6)-methyltransferase [Desulfogranum mediterraneum]|uniref:tRNA1(Val) (adenine(37)-N6)-methyltransferase n=1 Tax=Desulfogranum mediterraneum TaxID=160661 RepID=UPI0013786EFF|nr:methyltransferase [Desulfogranum mediterraneum]
MMATTADTLFEGRLLCRQHLRGYRFSIDAVLLAGFARIRPPVERVLDLCAGCGVVGLILAHRHPRLRVCGLELQPALAGLARGNGQDNGFAERYRVIQGDAREVDRYLEPESFELVVCNPPYRKGQTGRLNGSAEATIARHEAQGKIAEFVRAAAFGVQNRGRVLFVYPAARLGVLIQTMENQGLRVKRLQVVYSYPGVAAASLVLVEALKNGGEQCELLPPFFIYEHKNGAYSAAMKELYL